MGLQNGGKIREFAFAVPNRKFSIRFDNKTSRAKRPEYKVVVYLGTQQQHVRIKR